MKRGIIALLLIIPVLCSFNVFSHEAEPQEFNLEHSDMYPLSQIEAFGYGSLAFAILIAIILLFHKKMNEIAKKIVYCMVAVTAVLVTLYLVITTLHLNIISLTKGPVHWHADFEIWVCDKEIDLVDPKGLSNRVGPPLLHEHNDNRIHVEGVILDKKQASLGAFFYAVGGSLSYDGLKVPTDNGLISVHDSDLCSEKPANLYVFVNGKLIEDYQYYVLSPYERVPPGDRIKIIFTEKPLEEINTNII